MCKRHAIMNSDCQYFIPLYSGKKQDVIQIILLLIKWPTKVNRHKPTMHLIFGGLNKSVVPYCRSD